MSTEPIPMTDQDETLAFTQNLRRRVVNRLVGTHPTDMPDDPKVINAINQTLDSMDRQALVLKRMDQDKKRDSDDRAAAVLIAQINQKVGKGENIFRVDQPGSVKPATDIDAAYEMVAVRKINDGEDLIGIEEDSYDQYRVRLENDTDA